MPLHFFLTDADLDLLSRSLKAASALGLACAVPLPSPLLAHRCVHPLELQCAVAGCAEQGDGVEFVGDAEGTAFPLGYPGPKAGRVVGVAAQSHYVAGRFQADRAGLLSIDVVRKALL